MGWVTGRMINGLRDRILTRENSREGPVTTSDVDVCNMSFWQSIL